VSARSTQILGALEGLGGWGNSNRFEIDFTMAVLQADETTPRRTVIASSQGIVQPDSDPVPLGMPFPDNGHAEGSTDYSCDLNQSNCHILVVESREKKLYELYGATSSGSEVTAQGAFVWDLTATYPVNLRGEQCTSADPSGLPIAALMTTPDEVASGAIPHALRFLLPTGRIKKGVYVRPAAHAGMANSALVDAPPWGLRLRLRSTFDESGFNAGERVVLDALKKYGMILTDAGEIALTFSDDLLSPNKWAALGVTSQSFTGIQVGDFEVVDLGEEFPLTQNCTRAP
jgi:hypothetical protein